VTRAKDRLFLVRAFRRTLYGRSEVNAPSRFLIDIPEKLQVGGGIGDRKAAARQATENVTRWGPQGSTAPARPERKPARAGPAGAGQSGPAEKPVEKPAAPARNSQFKPGDRVDHGLFGTGIVLKSQVTADDEEVTVTFPGKGTKTLLASFARLRKL
jgi:DNA helicase II / ATP-dependent DNA helicase PcrA